ncbi:M23 family metallopeptidase [Luteococcus sp. Sow4_B9]|uniref:M23 family metallopeptidase n=1 Tax=Luteococcus sp. Sow4_B9 TaxID=3438792 RepID=UPI003F9B1074
MPHQFLRLLLVTLALLVARPMLVTTVSSAADLPTGPPAHALPQRIAPAPPPPLRRPVPGPLARPFDAPETRWGAGHRGVDLAAPPGTKITAGADGVVVFSGRVAGKEVVSIDIGDGYRLTHQPVRSPLRVGDKVTAGQVIGVLLAGECARGCLHWGLKRGQDYFDPLRRRSDDPIRLLPEGLAPPRARALPALAPIPFRSGPLPAASAGLVRPVAGPVTSRFGERLHPVLRVRKLHDGLDFGAACGTPVRSSAAGRVVQTQRHLAYGNRVVVDHGIVQGRQLVTSYNHLASLDVAPGQVLQQNQPLGRVGNTGYSTGCHLHYMVRANGQLQDPAGWV